MIIIGLTGSVGAGKTETSKFFKRNNVPVFDSDYQVKKIYKKIRVIKKIKTEFPEAFINNVLLKEKLAKIVFKDSRKLEVLEKIIYEYLKISRYLWIRKKFRDKNKVVVFDVPLLFEKDSVTKYDKIILVTCSEKIQKLRVLKRKGWDEKRFELTKNKQLEDKKKKKLADIIINTDRGKRYVFNRIKNILKKCLVAKTRPNNKIIYNFKL
ncbi:MAG: dephospho-CoA kinase [Pelagibacterales bacterium]|nr:dephospho-CoA kinase [Pelagibacterales bacterium]